MTNTTLRWLDQPPKEIDQAALDAAAHRQAILTKPPGALGRLEDIAMTLAAMQGSGRPTVDDIAITIFAADHGVADENVSAFPQTVTVEMIRNFSRGGAAISVLARAIDATLTVVDVGTVSAPGPLTGVIDRRIAAGTANLVRAAAMSEEQLALALAAGHEQAMAAKEEAKQLFIGGEMGIANTTSASSLACALLGLPGASMAGPGTGLDDQGVSHKVHIIDEALAYHAGKLDSPWQALRRLGGFEIAALTGAYITCAQQGLAVLVDGFISSVAALTAARLLPGAEAWFFYGHRSAEPAHQRILAALAAEPLLDMGMRLGEGSGAAVAVPLLRQACALHNDMATFAEAGVSEKRS